MGRDQWGGATPNVIRRPFQWACRKNFCRGKLRSQRRRTQSDRVVVNRSDDFIDPGEAGEQAVNRHCNALIREDYFGR